MERINWTYAIYELYAETFEKKNHQKNQIFQNLTRPSFSHCNHQQPYNFFSVFADFRTLADNSGKLKLGSSKKKDFRLSK